MVQFYFPWLPILALKFVENSRPTENVSVIINVSFWSLCCGEHDDDVNMNLNKLIQLNDLYLGASKYQETGRERERSG